MPSIRSSEEMKQRAQAHFERGEQRRAEAAKAQIVDYRAAINIDAAKTIRLRALRLAKEAADELAKKAQTAEKEARAALPKAARKRRAHKTERTAESDSSEVGS